MESFQVWSEPVETSPAPGSPEASTDASANLDPPSVECTIVMCFENVFLWSNWQESVNPEINKLILNFEFEIIVIECLASGTTRLPSLIHNFQQHYITGRFPMIMCHCEHTVHCAADATDTSFANEIKHSTSTTSDFCVRLSSQK